MKILFFGRLAESLGREAEVDVPASGCTVAELRQRLGEDVASPGIRACIDQLMVGEEERVLPHHEVAFLPPLSGG